MDGNVLGGDVVMGKVVYIEILNFMIKLLFYKLIILCICVCYM